MTVFCVTCGGLEGVDAHGLPASKGGHRFLHPVRDPCCIWCAGTGWYDSPHNGDLRQCDCRPPPKDPCPWSLKSERAVCRCSQCQINCMRHVLDAARGVRHKTKALREALAAYDARFGR